MRFIILIACAVLSVALAVSFNKETMQSCGKSLISYGWAAACGAAGLIAFISWNDKDGWLIPLIITVILSVISLKKCKERTLEATGDEALVKKAMFIQFILPFGVIVVFLVFSALFSKNDKNKKNSDSEKK